MSENERSIFASSSVPRHLMRGAIGFALIAAALVLSTSRGPLALLLAPIGVVALRGCPTCWIVGLIETISAGRLKRSCTEDGCRLSAASTRGGLMARARQSSPPAR
jgi:hypothetical protein